MNQDEISTLLQRYLAACRKGVEPYFDADELGALLDSLEEKDEVTHYEPLLKLGLRLHPDNPDLKVRKCRYFLYCEEYQKALDYLATLTEIDDEEADMIRLECYCALGKYPQAVEYMEELIKADCDYMEELFEYLTPALSDLEMMGEARHMAEWGLQMFPDNPVLKDELCYLCEVEGDFDKAITLCNELIDQEPYSYDYWFTLGRLYSMTNDFDNAIDAFDFALACDDSDEDLKVLKAYCLFMNENYEKALEVYSEITTNEISANRIKILMAECCIKLDDYEQAYRMLKEIVDEGSDACDVGVYISLIRCCVETDRKKEASQVLLDAAGIFPDNVRILSLLALNYLESGREELAMEITGKILQQLNSIHEEHKDDEEYQKFFKDKNTMFSDENLGKIATYYKKILHFNPDALFATKYIPPEDLTKEYLSDKNNSN
ncbi:MAG: tetratricopeptide repeat protein [Tannerellaceae bacterium]|jgi:tetratricopeptide (TPR) repeat protein|nr:tetratricopeptide repeat protein [Tannerellaceae bacterium]